MISYVMGVKRARVRNKTTNTSRNKKTKWIEMKKDDQFNEQKPTKNTKLLILKIKEKKKGLKNKGTSNQIKQKCTHSLDKKESNTKLRVTHKTNKHTHSNHI